MKVTLLVPPSSRPQLTELADGGEMKPPLGPMALAAVLGDDHDVSLIDGQMRRYTLQAMIEAVIAEQPDLLGISVSFSNLWESAKRAAAAIREALGPDLPIVWGGNVATFRYSELLRDRFADIVVRYEADRSFPELLRRMDGGDDWRETPGIAWLEGDEIRTGAPAGYIDDLDELPFPAYSCLEDEQRYQRVLISTRGCPHGCIYCSTRQMWGIWRARSVQNVLEEIAWHVEQADMSRLSFTDDNFAATRQRVFDICDGIERAGWDFRWGFSARIEQIDAELVSACAQTNVTRIFFGVESGSARVLKKLGRNYTPEEVYRKIDMCVEKGIVPICSFMTGIPWETMEDAEQTLEMLERLNTPLVQLHVFTPLIGTPVCLDPERYGVTVYEDDQGRDTMDSSVRHSTRYLSREKITELHLDGKGIVAERAAEIPAYMRWVETLRG